jgi:mRNA interferase YafQ
MRSVSYLSGFDKDQARMTRRGKDVRKLVAAVFLLAKNGLLPLPFRAHKLHGEYDGYWECHLESDWLLVYKLTTEKVLLFRTGTHSDIFE